MNAPVPAVTIAVAAQAYNLILLPGEFTGSWTDAVAWAKEQGGELPTRAEQLLLFANARDEFEKDWYWSGEQYAGDSAYAWCQGFSYGDQDTYHKDDKLRARAVRREPIQPFAHSDIRRDLTLRELQVQLPWTTHYSRDFRAAPMTHKDFGHALLHITKASGRIAAVVNDAEHGGSEFKPEELDRFVADLVICALRMANTCPGRTIDLQRAVEDRIEQKNDAELRRVQQ